MGDPCPPKSGHPTTGRPHPARPRRWGRIAAVAVLSAGTAWAAGRVAQHRIQSLDIAIASRRQAPAAGIRDDPRAAIHQHISRMGWVPNLDGTAVAYAAEADDLVAPDGRFRTDLSARDAARILHIDRAAIARPNAADEIDPDAVLFRAQSGTLTAQSKAMSLQRREEQAAGGLTPDAAVRDWDVRHFAFTLERLRHPDEAERTVMSAIGRSRLLISPEPGDTIRAIPVNRGDLEDGKVALWPGMLPPEVPTAAARPSRRPL